MGRGGERVEASEVGRWRWSGGVIVGLVRWVAGWMREVVFRGRRGGMERGRGGLKWVLCGREIWCG